MAKTITQKIVFKNTTPNVLYELYMNPKKHSLATGASAKISAKVGSKYSAHNGYITGKNLELVKNKLIVQTWRAQDWNKEDADSIFVIFLQQKGNDVVLEMTHANIPDKHAPGINDGWQDYYWKKWKRFLAGKSVEKSPGM